MPCSKHNRSAKKKRRNGQRQKNNVEQMKLRANNKLNKPHKPPKLQLQRKPNLKMQISPHGLKRGGS